MQPLFSHVNNRWVDWKWQINSFKSPLNTCGYFYNRDETELYVSSGSMYLLSPGSHWRGCSGWRQRCRCWPTESQSAWPACSAQTLWSLWGTAAAAKRENGRHFKSAGFMQLLFNVLIPFKKNNKTQEGNVKMCRGRKQTFLISSSNPFSKYL